MVKYGGKKGYIRNDKFDREYLSNFGKIKLKSAAVCYSKPSTASKYKVKALAKGKKLRLISKITKGKKKGWSIIKGSKKDYYIKTKSY